jgi:excisionase family DNA binding protein
VADGERLHLEDRLALRPAEAAKVLGIGERTLRQLLPELPTVRVGTAVLIPKDLLRKWLIDQARESGRVVDRAVEDVLKSLEE